MNEIIKALNWRYATKKYDPSRKVSEENLKILKEATQLSVSSMGLQPYKILIVQDEEIREKLKVSAFGQDAITNSSALFVFAIETHLGHEQIDAYLHNISETRAIGIESLEGFKNMLNGSINGQSEEQAEEWAKKQAYIALSTLINTAAFLHIDATPMEGFNAADFDTILNLEKLGLKTAVIAAVGYRHTEDVAQHYKKVRKPENELFINI